MFRLYTVVSCHHRHDDHAAAPVHLSTSAESASQYALRSLKGIHPR